MAQPYFYYFAINAGNSTALLQSSHEYQDSGMHTLVLTAEIDHRVGLSSQAQIFNNHSILYAMVSVRKINSSRCIVSYWMKSSF